MRLARVPALVEEAAKRLRDLDRTVTPQFGQNSLHVAFSGGLGPRVRNQVVADLQAVLDAINGRPPTMTEIFRGDDGPSAA